MEPNARRAIAALEALGVAGCCVECVTCGRDAIARIEQRDIDIAIVDAALSDCSALDVVREVRGTGVTIPLLILGVDAVAHGIAILDAGADDFLPQPYVMVELVARTQALVRRARGPRWP